MGKQLLEAERLQIKGRAMTNLVMYECRLSHGWRGSNCEIIAE